VLTLAIGLVFLMPTNLLLTEDRAICGCVPGAIDKAPKMVAQHE
jgi:hypothetical protein